MGKYYRTFAYVFFLFNLSPLFLPANTLHRVPTADRFGTRPLAGLEKEKVLHVEQETASLCVFLASRRRRRLSMTTAKRGAPNRTIIRQPACVTTEEEKFKNLSTKYYES